MYLFDFATKLTRLNPRLFIDTRKKVEISSEWTSTGIYLKEPEGCKHDFGLNLNYGVQGAGKYLDEIYRAKRDKYICGVSLQWVPEYCIFEKAESGSIELSAPGWRGILLHLSKSRYFSVDRAKLVFGASSLGEHTFDRSTFEQKQEIAKREMER